jgi:GDP-4-dehydro-6-deoxy-D-mannose reductase
VPASTTTRTPIFQWNLADGVTPKAYQRVAAFQPDVIYHLAAVSVPSDCGADEPTPAAASTNIDGTRSIVELCRRLDNKPRVLFASTCYVYSPVTPDQPVVAEDALTEPVRAYGKTKLAAEQILRDAIKDHSVDAVIARSFQHTGPRQSPRMILPDWATQLLRPSAEPLRAICLDTYLDLSDVRDMVRSYRLLVLDGTCGSVYNVGSGVSRKSGDILKAMLACTQSTRDVIELQPGRRQHPIADISKIREQTGWVAEIPFERTIIDTLNYWRERGMKT